MVVTAIVLIIALTGWIFSLATSAGPPTTRQPVPADVPPAAAQGPPLIDVHGPGRTADGLIEWSSLIAERTAVDPQAVRAYANAALIARDAWPGCHLQWNTLAGIGWVETRHGTYTGHVFDGTRLDPDGFAKPPIIGPPLDGSGSFAEIRDTDGGALDGDTTFDRAVGPMQFIPGTWAQLGRDANGDGEANPQQIDDAALAAANLLCSHGRDLATPEGWRDAVFSYNNSNDYVVKVRDAAANYALNQPAHR
ncbi:lytic transglycosylase domain-containing protein [Corynebacterium liangguodongii]|uniref:Uncharacterized protein n=1 Tax=Corynebacterium liangguodongii TaxID=2079535 RepID=A0A2S0WH71_9CORY|nr:lytic murein transglycosylase [Corynebacterium liangguodongii]AWB85115.1 hypothetical protein C3E79_08070 [Corynebacterium liangguodongii]PWB99970.1 hypothetical protein DF219_04665 [Corynebacterium liangguodongii]